MVALRSMYPCASLASEGSDCGSRMLSSDSLHSYTSERLTGGTLIISVFFSLRWR